MVMIVVESDDGWKPAEAASDEGVAIGLVNGTMTLVLLSVNLGTDVFEPVEVEETVPLGLGIPGGANAEAEIVSCDVALVAVVLELLGTFKPVLLEDAVVPV